MLTASLIAFGAILVAWVIAPDVPRAKATTYGTETSASAMPAHA